MSEVCLSGPLAAPEMLDALDLIAGPGETLPGHLVGGAGAGIGGDWPRLEAGGELPIRRTAGSPALRRYAEIMGLEPQDADGRALLGLGRGGGADWSAGQSALMADIAREVLRLPSSRTAASIARRLPQIAAMCHARMAGRAAPPARALLPDPARANIEIISRTEPYADYFAVEQWRLRHALHRGGMSAPIDRAVFMSPDAVLVLPWDQKRDHVLLISQFRMGPLARADRQPWLLEPIAGRVDAGETPQEAARRETMEEAGITLGDLIALPGHYPTPGANSEFFHPFIAHADLPPSVRRDHGGAADEDEDIATHIIPRAELTELAASGALRAGPLLLLSLLLDRHAALLAAS